MSLKRTPFKRKPPASYTKPERIAPAIQRLSVKVTYPVFGDPVSIPKAAPVRSEVYRRLVAELPCIYCGIVGYSQAAHPPPTGKGIKEDDRECFPLCCIHPGPSGDLLLGCHADFDQYRLIPKVDMRATAAHWGKDTREIIQSSGQWPDGLPFFETELEQVP